jgi:hypothetical protein
MLSHYTYQDTNISLKISFRNIRRSSPTRDQNWPLETQKEETNRTTNLAEGFTVLTTTLNKLNLINMPSSTKDYIVRKRLHSNPGQTTIDNNNSNNRRSLSPSPAAKLSHHIEMSLTSSGRQTQRQQRRIRFAPPPAAKLSHHREMSLTSSGRQTQRQQRRIRFAPPPAAKLSHHREMSLTSSGRQTQRQQRRIRFAPPPAAKL